MGGGCCRAHEVSLLGQEGICLPHGLLSPLSPLSPLPTSCPSWPGTQASPSAPVTKLLLAVSCCGANADHPHLISRVLSGCCVSELRWYRGGYRGSGEHQPWDPL